jgi:hypothetical protein
MLSDLKLGITIASSVFFFGCLLIFAPISQNDFRTLAITIHVLCAIVAFGIPFIQKMNKKIFGKDLTK